MDDLMMTAGKDVENYVQRLDQMAKTWDIHLVIDTQKPSVDIITGNIKANVQASILFPVAIKYEIRKVIC